MQTDIALGDRHHRAAFNLLPDLPEELIDQRGQIGTAKPFSTNADHRR